MLTLTQRQERAARRAARIAAKHEAIRAAACTDNERSRVMKKHEVKVGSVYLAKVSDKVVPVRITGTSGHGGWDAVNETTGKKVRIKSAQRLRGPAEQPEAVDAKCRHVVADAPTAAPAAQGAKPDGKAAKDAKAAPKAPKAKREAKKRDGLSGLDAAAKVLVLAGKPMNTKEMVEKMLADGLWKTGGKTPAATIYAAILREVRAKGKDARFRKTERGKFEATAAARQ